MQKAKAAWIAAVQAVRTEIRNRTPLKDATQ